MFLRILPFLFIFGSMFAGDITDTEFLNIVTANHQAFLKHTYAGDAQKVADLYTEDAVTLFPGAPMTKGRFMILAQKKTAFAKVNVLDGKLETLELSRDGTLGYEVGRFRYVTQAMGHDPRTITGTFMVVWLQGSDGVWRIKAETGIPDPA